MWADWTTTVSGSENPMPSDGTLIDQSANHVGEPNGGGYLVHAPVVVVEDEDEDTDTVRSH
jgi:hypothetical protein